MLLLLGILLTQFFDTDRAPISMGETYQTT
jgi:hypothetical protein